MSNFIPLSRDLTASLLLASAPAFLLGSIALLAARWYTGPAPDNRRSYFILGVRFVAWFLVITSFAVGTFMVMPEFMIIPGICAICLISLTAVIAVTYSKHNATQQYAMLALVGAATERSMPLEDAFDAFGHERGGWMRRRSEDIVHLLLHGLPLPAALEQVPGVLPADALPMVRVGCACGALPEAIRRTIATRNLIEPVWQSIVPKILYLCVFPSAAMGILSFVGLRILPQYEKIFKDYGLRLPGVTQWLFHSAGSNVLLVVLPFAWLLATCLAGYMLLRYCGSIRWDLPGMGWITRKRHTAALLDGLALAAERQKPFGDAVAQLAVGYPQRGVARRLKAANRDIQAGGNDLHLLQRHGLLSQADIALLQAAARNGNFAWAARELADSHRRRMIYRTYALVQAIFPPMILIYGLVVAVICVAMFLPLIELIQSLAPLPK